jgi:hypothetical protein
MGLPLDVLFFVAVSLLIVWWAIRGNLRAIHNIDDVRSLMKQVDLHSFQNLIDPAQDAYLHRHLPGRAFRKVQRARRIAAAEYLWDVAQNAGLLVRAGQFATAANDAQVASVGRNLASAAVMTRVLALLALARVSMGIVFPQAPARCRPVLDQYGVLTTLYMHLGLLWRAQRSST